MVTTFSKHISIFNIILLVVSALVSLFLPITGWVFFCASLARRIPGKLSYAENLFFIFLAAIVFNAFLYEIFSLANFYPSMSSVGVFYVFLGFAVIMLLPLRKSMGLINKRFIVSMVAALVVFIGVMYPVTFTKNSRVSHTAAILHLLSSGEDNASHYSLFKYAYEHNGYAYNQDAEKTGLIQGLVNYPQGSEFSLAWFANSIMGDSYKASDGVLVAAYYTLVAFSYSILSFIVVLVGLTFYESTGNKIKLPHAVTAIVLVFGCIAISPLLTLLGRGFQSQIMSYIYLVALVFATSKIAYTTSFKLRLVLTASMLSGICITWWFLVPVALFPTLLFLLRERRQFIDLLRRNLKFAATILIMASLAVYPIIINILSGYTSSGSINQPGGVDTIAPTTILLYLLACVSTFVFIRSRKLLTSLESLAVTLVCWLIFTFSLGLYQQLTLHYFAYYYYKSLYSLIPLSGILVILMSMLLIDKPTEHQTRAQKISFSLLLFLGFVTFIISVKPVYPRVYANDWYNNLITNDEIASIYSNSKYGMQDMVFVGGCGESSNYIQNRWTGALFLSESYWHREIDAASFNNNTGRLAILLDNAPYKKSNIYVHIDESCLGPKLEKVVKDGAFPTNIEK